ncbi:hypothetical protein H4K36_00185 [Streptomyces sp. DHE7-1]|nr:hypothetical protein [Streptomyces sp. DHE7-1]
MADVLGLDHVGARDDFFALGGDSITSIQLVSRARSQGLVLTPREIFTHRSVAAMAEVAQPLPDERPPSGDDGTGTLAAVPVLREAELNGAADTLYQSVLLRSPAGLTSDRLTALLQTLTDHHAMLRARYTSSAPGEHGQIVVAPTGTVRATDRITRVAVPDGDVPTEVLTHETAAARSRLRPADGAVLQAVWFDAGPERQGRLYLALHHVAVDAVSWHVLLMDLRTLWEAGDRATAADLLPVGTSYHSWVQGLMAMADSSEVIAEMPHWQKVLEPPSAVGTAAVPGPASAATGTTATVVLPREETAALLTTVPAAFGCRPDDVMLTALAAAVTATRGADPGAGTDVVVDVEGHGRHETAPGQDLSRTVGWFTSVHPVRLDAGRVGQDKYWESPSAAARALKAVKEQIRATPGHGLGHGLLRHVNTRTAPLLAALPAAPIRFNYLGRVPGGDFGDAQDWTEAPESAHTEAPTGPPPGDHGPLEVNALVRGGGKGARLEAEWSDGHGTLAPHEVRLLAGRWIAALAELVALLPADAGSGLTPSDVPLSGLTQDEIELIESGWDAE